MVLKILLVSIMYIILIAVVIIFTQIQFKFVNDIIKCLVNIIDCQQYDMQMMFDKVNELVDRFNDLNDEISELKGSR